MFTYIDVFNEGKFLQYEELSRELNIPDAIFHVDSIQVNKPAQVRNYASYSLFYNVVKTV